MDGDTNKIIVNVLTFTDEEIDALARARMLGMTRGFPSLDELTGEGAQYLQTETRDTASKEEAKLMFELEPWEFEKMLTFLSDPKLRVPINIRVGREGRSIRY